MTKVTISKDVLYYLSVQALPDDGNERAGWVGGARVLAVQEAARRIKAAAILGPIEIVVT